MIDLIQISQDRISEPLSQGENIKKLLELHVSHYNEQILNSSILEKLKNIDEIDSSFLDWIGICKGVYRPKTTVNSEDYTQFFNIFTPDNFGFSNVDISKPLFFSQENYFKVDDNIYRIILKAFCFLTNFKGTVDEYSYFFKEVFEVDIQLRQDDNKFIIILENTNFITLDLVLIFGLTPVLPQTKNVFYRSPYSLFSLSFNNISGTNLDFDDNKSNSLYFYF